MILFILPKFISHIKNFRSDSVMIVFIVNWYQFWYLAGGMFGFDISCAIAQDTCVAWYPANLDVEISTVEYVKFVDEISNNWVIISVI